MPAAFVGGAAGIAPGEDEAIHHDVAADEGQLALIDAAGAGTAGVAAWTSALNVTGFPGVPMFQNLGSSVLG